MNRHRSGTRALALLSLLLSCATATPTRPVASSAPAAVNPALAETLKVGLYPDVPRLQQFKDVIAAAWRLKHPDVALDWATNWDGGYSADPDSSYDVFVFDAIYLSYFNKKGYLHPLTKADVTGYDDLAPFAAIGVSRGDQVLAIPQLGCGEFLFYHSTDAAVGAATTTTELMSALGTCTYNGEVPPDAATGLMVDLAGGTTDASAYIESVHETADQYPIALPDAAHLDPLAIRVLQDIVAMSSGNNARYDNDKAPYQRATWFGQGHGRAYVGFLESMSQIDRASLATISFKPMLWSNKATGATSPLFYSDVVGIGAGTATRGTTQLAVELANLMTSPDVIVEVFGPSSRSGPQYLMPVRASALRTLATQDPVYAKMAAVLEGLHPVLFDLGADSKDWLALTKSAVKSSVYANPRCSASSHN